MSVRDIFYNYVYDRHFGYSKFLEYPFFRVKKNALYDDVHKSKGSKQSMAMRKIREKGKIKPNNQPSW